MAKAVVVAYMFKGLGRTFKIMEGRNTGLEQLVAKVDFFLFEGRKSHHGEQRFVVLFPHVVKGGM